MADLPSTWRRSAASCSEPPVEDLAALRQRAELVDVAAAVAHEVSNAVGAIAGWAQLATSPGSGVSAQEALELIARCARTAQQAAHTMLSAARGDASAVAQDIDFSAHASDMLRLLSLSAREARVRLTSEIEPELRVQGSRSALFTTLWNLTKNALEACPVGGAVHVVLRAHDGRVVLEVRDTGPGLTDEQITRVFDSYYTTKSSGTGLGLALVQKVVAALAGELFVESTPGRGACFRVSLPRAPEADSVVTSRPSAIDAATRRLHARILVIDDDDALREMVATALSLRGATVETANGSAAAEQLQGRFDVALIDFALVDCRGDELLATLRSRGIVTAAMLVTGTVQKPRLVPGGEPDDWLRKPFELTQLVERIQRTLERHAMLQEHSGTG